MQNCRRKTPDKIVYTDRWTDRQTDGPTAMAIPVYPPPICHAGIIKAWQTTN